MPIVAGAGVGAELDGDVRVWDVAELAGSRRLVPACPGVYTFIDAAGTALYVGKSVDLRSRLSSYFGASARRRKTARMMRLAYRVRAERCGSEFAALLREAELVQALRPPFNRRMATPESYVYLRVDYAHPFPRLSLARELDDDGRFLGPFVQRRPLVEMVDALNDAFRLRTCEVLPAGEPCWRLQVRRCSAPCVGEVEAGRYGRQFLVVREALCGRTTSALRDLRGARDRHAAAERFEAAASVQKKIEAIERLRRVLFASQAPGCDAIVVQPALSSGEIEMWAVAGGSVRASGICRGDDPSALFESVWKVFGGVAAEEPMAKEELDRRCIVHAWVRSPRHADAIVSVRGLGRSEARSAVAAMARRQVERTGWLL